MKKIIFIILFIITCALFMNSLLFLSNSRPKTSIPSFYSPVNIILDGDFEDYNSAFIEYNGGYYTIPKSSEVHNKELFGKIDGLKLFIKQGAKTRELVIFNGLKINYYEDFSALKTGVKEFCPNGNCQKYDEYYLSVNNERGWINVFSAGVLNALGGGGFAVLIPCLFLILTVFYYVNNFKFRLNGYFTAGLILITGILLRLNGLFSYLPWGDEYYSVEFSTAPFFTVFMDPGNPPLFYIILWFYFKIFGISLYTIKFFPFIAGITALITLWAVFKKIYDLKIANGILFLAAINIPLVYYSQELRSYILQVLFCPLMIYFLYKIIKEQKFFAWYGIIGALAANLHYYEIFFLISMFFLFFLVCKDKETIKKFIITNLFIGLSFLPFFFFTSFGGALLNSNFNTWIPPLTLKQIANCVFYVSGGLISFIILCFSIKKVKFLGGIIAGVVFFGIIASILIRPMLVERYLVLLIPVILAIISIVSFKYVPKKYSAVFFLIWLLIFQAGSFEKNNNKKGVIEGPMNISAQYKKIHSNEDIYVILNTFLNAQKSLPYYLDSINYISKTLSEVENTVDEIQNGVIFTSLLKSGGRCYFNSTSDMCIWRIKKL